MIYPITSGRQRDDTIYVMYHWSAGVGVGAVKGRDGFNCNGAIINLCGIKLPNVEGYEQNYPVHFLKVEFRTDAGGPGMYRGGTGIDYVVDLEQYSVLTVRGEGLWTPSGFGTAGGMDGAAGQMSLDPLEGERLRKYEVRNIGPTRLSIQSAGGGGWGNPFSRDADRVLRDIRDEVVSKEAARQIYGVVADETGRSIDAQKTNALRQQMTATLQRVV
jgi:N-methylhydantoinase B